MRLIYLLLFLSGSLLSFSQQTVRHTVYFDFDEDLPNAVSHTALTAFTEKIKTLPVTSIDVLGFTDKKGSHAYNDELSSLRANAVANFLHNNLPRTIALRIDFFGKDSLLTIQDTKQEVNRRVEIIAYYTVPPEKKYTELSSCFEDVETQRYAINLDDTVFITARQGTKLKINPGSIVTHKGIIAKGKAELLIREYYQQGDILLAGLHTNSDKGLLQTGGMLYMLIVQNGDTMAPKTKKPVTINMPVINNTRGNMTVFTMDHNGDTAAWNSTGRSFRQIFARWDWPPRTGKLEEVTMPEIGAETWRIGGVFHDTYRITNGWFYRPYHRRASKFVTRHVERVDSATLSVNIKIKFRNRGVRRYGMREFDTSFTVKYLTAMYEGITNTMNWINCDRFLNYPYVTDFYVSTPEFSGASVMVYFKDLNAVMPAYRTGKDLFSVVRVPPGEKVWIIAFGKNGSEYYFSKKAYTTSDKETASLNLSKITHDDLKKELQKL